jgi:hypothetical protein
MILVAVALSLLGAVSSVPMLPNIFVDTVDALIQIRVISDVPTTMADWTAMQRLNVTEPPECPFANDVFACDVDGHLLELNLNAPPLAEPRSAGRLSLGQFVNDRKLAKIRVRNFVGELSLFYSKIKHLEVHDSILVNATWPTCDVTPVGCKYFVNFWRYEGNTTLIMSNVTVLDSFLQPAQVELWNFTFQQTDVCRFHNVTMACPVPSWVAPCFNVTTSAMIPCVAPTSNASAAFVPLPPVCDRTAPFCRLQCTPEPLAGFACARTGVTPTRYFPATPGFSIIDITMRSMGVAHSVSLDVRMLGLMTRVEVFNFHTFNWTIIELPGTRIPATTKTRVELMLPPVLTNRVRITLEQWYVETDILYDFEVSRQRFDEYRPPLPAPPPRCTVAESLDVRSNLDETIGDSYCIGRICQLACQAAVNFTFDRAVVPQFVVIEGGEQWSGAELIATPSDRTRVYRYNRTSSGIKWLNISSADVGGGVSRVRLIGDPVNGEPLPAATLPPRGFPGVLVKRWHRAVPVGLLNASASSTIAACAPLPVNAVSWTRVLNTMYAFTSDGVLMQCVAAARWEAVAAAKLTAPLLNQRAAIPVRKLVAVGDRLLGVVVASVVVHDGSVNRLFVNRQVTTTAIDVLDVKTNVWYGNLVQHDIQCCNISDVDVVQNASMFAVVDRARGAASVFEWRPYAYELTECGANSDCRTCLTSEANVERCRWCDSRCVSQFALCNSHLNETSTLNVAHCKNVTTTTMTMTTTTPATSDNLSSASAPITQSVSNGTVAMVSNGEADPLIPLYAVLGGVSALAVVAVIVGLIWKLRNSHNDNDANVGNDAGDVQMADRAKSDQPANERYTAFDEDEGPAKAYDDSSVLQ